MARINAAGSEHEDCIKRLVEEFGPEREAEIRAIYQENIRNLEIDARILLYLPVLALNSSRKTLKAKFRQQR